jgi:hypothetical protein
MMKKPNGPEPIVLPAHIKPLYPIREFGRTFGVGHTKTYELIASGQLKAVKIGSRTAITGETAYLWMQTLPELTSTKASGRE